MPRGRAYLAWLVVCVVWGTTYLAIRIAIESLPPLLMAGVRWLIAGGVLIVWFRLRGAALPGRRSWPAMALRGVLLIGFGNGAVVWAERTVPSGLAAVLVAMMPFWMVGFDRLFGSRTLDARSFAAVGLGFIGVLVLVWPDLHLTVGRTAFLQGVAATQLACAGWAVGSLIARRDALRATHSPTATALEMLFGGLVLTIAGLTIGESTTMVTGRSVAAFVYLIIFGSLVAFSAYRYALNRLPVATVSLYAYVNTVIAVLLGAFVLGEPLSWRIAIGAGVVLAGVSVVKRT